METDLVPGQINRTRSEAIYPGGKGINVSLSLQRLGQETRALGFAAGRIGQTIRDLLDDLGCPNTFLELKRGQTTGPQQALAAYSSRLSASRNAPSPPMETSTFRAPSNWS